MRSRKGWSVDAILLDYNEPAVDVCVAIDTSTHRDKQLQIF